MKKKLKFLFIIQGEGRGHITQAIRLKQILEENHHQVSKIFIGTNSSREFPEYIRSEFSGEIQEFSSPGFVRSNNLRGIRVSASILRNLLNAPIYLKSISKLRKAFRENDIDVIVNFYDMIGGIAYHSGGRGRSYFAVSHQFLFEQPGFPVSDDYFMQKRLLRIHNHLVCGRRGSRIALSFLQQQDFGKTMVLPPLIRREVLDAKVVDKKFILVYLLNEGLAVDLLPIFKSNQNLKFRVFANLEKFSFLLPENVTIEKPGYSNFGKALVECSAVICSSGFETTGEANFLGKPVFLIPSDNHYEQHGNLLDAERNGMAKSIRKFHPAQIKERVNSNFKNWCLRAPEMYLKALCE